MTRCCRPKNTQSHLRCRPDFGASGATKCCHGCGHAFRKHPERRWLRNKNVCVARIGRRDLKRTGGSIRTAWTVRIVPRKLRDAKVHGARMGAKRLAGPTVTNLAPVHPRSHLCTTYFRRRYSGMSRHFLLCCRILRSSARLFHEGGVQDQ